jgi:hypothetical protein
MPIVQCQTIPTQGHVLDIGVCYQLDSLGDFFNFFKKKKTFHFRVNVSLETPHVAGLTFHETKPVLVTTSEGLWILLPVPFLAQVLNNELSDSDIHIFPNPILHIMILASQVSSGI